MKIADHAKTNDLAMTITEGGNHTKIQVGDSRAVIPRHSEINELTPRPSTSRSE